MSGGQIARAFRQSIHRRGAADRHHLPAAGRRADAAHARWAVRGIPTGRPADAARPACDDGGLRRLRARLHRHGGVVCPGRLRGRGAEFVRGPAGRRGADRCHADALGGGAIRPRATASANPARARRSRPSIHHPFFFHRDVSCERGLW